jgi:hypothetical protein
MGTTLFIGLWEFIQRRCNNTNRPSPSETDVSTPSHRWYELMVTGDYVMAKAKPPDMVPPPSLLKTPSVLNLLRGLLSVLGSADLLLQQMNGGSTDSEILDKHLKEAHKDFVELYITVLSHKPPPSVEDQPTLHGPLQSIQSSFYASPFNITVEESYTEEIATQLTRINSDQDFYTLVIREMAKQWVDDKLKLAPTAQDRREAQRNVLGEAQSAVLTVLLSVLSSEMSNIKEGVVNALHVEPLSYARLVELRDRVKKEIDREREKRCSVAFCGLAKAGCVGIELTAGALRSSPFYYQKVRASQCIYGLPDSPVRW